MLLQIFKFGSFVLTTRRNGSYSPLLGVSMSWKLIFDSLVLKHSVNIVRGFTFFFELWVVFGARLWRPSLLPFIHHFSLALLSMLTQSIFTNYLPYFITNLLTCFNLLIELTVIVRLTFLFIPVDIIILHRFSILEPIFDSFNHIYVSQTFVSILLYSISALILLWILLIREFTLLWVNYCQVFVAIIY